jgi:nucleoside-triphosphatase
MVTEEIREGKTRTGFYVENIITHERGILAMVGSGEGPRIGKYTVSLRDFEAVGVKAIQAAIEDADVMVVDELGPMELNSGRFIESVEEALNSRKHIVGTIHKRATHPLVMAVKSNANFTIVEVTAENRGELPPQIIDRILQAR